MLANLRSRTSIRALLLFAAAALLLSSGRLHGLDPGAQYLAAETFVTTGSAGRELWPGYSWLLAPNGRFYEVHDIGNLLLMLPAAAVSSALGFRTDLASGHPPIVALGLVSITYALFAAVAWTVMWSVLRLRTQSVRAALVLVAIFVLATPYGAYHKAAFDVLGAALGAILLCAALLRVLEEQAPGPRLLVSAGLATALPGYFRFTFLPAVVIGAGLVLLVRYRRTALRPLLVWGSTTAVATVPSLAYNHLRTGRFWEPGPARYVEEPLSADLFDGLVWWLLSPADGLFFFSPVLALALFARGDRLRPLLVGLAVYVVLVALQPVRPPVDWGPRYLVPAVGILWILAAPVLHRLWRERQRAIAIGFVVPSLLIGVMPVLSAWGPDLVEYQEPYAASPLVSRDVDGVAASISRHVSGTGRFDDGTFYPYGIGREPSFPDFWWVNGWQISPRVGLLCSFLAGGLLLVALGATRLLWRRPRSAAEPLARPTPRFGEGE